MKIWWRRLTGNRKSSNRWRVGHPPAELSPSHSPRRAWGRGGLVRTREGGRPTEWRGFWSSGGREGSRRVCAGQVRGAGGGGGEATGRVLLLGTCQ
jgi:hypothetical protein